MYLNFLKRALMAVVRKKGKTVVMFIIFAAIANMVLAGLAIQHATQYASVLARQKLGGKLILRYDTQKALEQAREQNQSNGERLQIQPEPVTEDMAKSVASLKDISDYNLIVNTNGLAQGFDAVVTDSIQQQNPGSNNQRSNMFGNGFGNSRNFVMPDVSVTGVSSSSLMDDFKNGTDKMLSGRAIKPTDAGNKVALIEKILQIKII